MEKLSLISFHSQNKTPLRNLANSVSWFSEMASRAASGSDRQAFRRKEKTMRAVITALFIERHLAGQYEDHPVAA